VFELGWVLEFQLYPRAYAKYAFAFELLQIMREFIAADPDLAQVSFLIQDLLPRGVKLSKHPHFLYLQNLCVLNQRDSDIINSK
jgi:hypothetical protein